MPTPVVPYQIPDWANPANASVLDSWAQKALRTLGQVTGLADPVSQVMGLAAAPVDVPAANLAEGLGAQTLKAYHGSPYDFNQFDASKIGTGEGAAAYGHGLYFAENPAVAKEYQKSLSPQGKFAIHVNGERLSFRDAAEKALGPKTGGDLATYYESGDALRRGQMDKMEVLSGLGEKLKEQGHSVEYSPTGRMFEVNLHTSPEELLDWDKPLSQQSPKVQDALKALWQKKGGTLEGRTLPPFAAHSEADGQSAYNAISTTFGPKAGNDAQLQAAGAQALKDAGIKGIQYLDQGSRAAGEGTKNFVIFDDKIIEIAKKYGVALPVAAEIARRQQIGAKNGNVESSAAP